MDSERSIPPRIDVVVLNYKAATMTLDCLESLASLEKSVAFRVWLVDNASPDGSGEVLREWMTTRARAAFPLGGVFIAAPANLGFAGGNNLALREILREATSGHSVNDFVWLLNNDTLVPAESLRHLVAQAVLRKLDIAGSLLRLYPDGGIQAYGGRIHPCTATSTFITRPEELPSVNYIVGASMLVRTTVFVHEGLIPEDYFLYSEEADFCLGATRHGYKLGCVPESVVHHRHGSSTGGGAEKGAVPFFSDCLMVRNRTVLGRKYLRGPGVWLGLLAALYNRMRRRQIGRITTILRLLFQPGYLEQFVAQHAQGVVRLPSGKPVTVLRFGPT